MSARELPAILAKGNHADHEAMCVMEAVAYVAGEPWGDHPACASPLLTSFAIGLNDAIDDDDRRTALLKPLVPLLVGTRDGNDLTRSYHALDWLVRVYVPTWLSLVPALEPRAAALRDLPPITGPVTFGVSVRVLLSASQKDADAAWDAAGDAAGDAAWDAAGDAAGDAADLLKRMCEVR